MRLQPISNSGVSRARSAGSGTPVARLCSAIRLAGQASLGCHVKPGT